jgi:hypothetical protein
MANKKMSNLHFEDQTRLNPEAPIPRSALPTLLGATVHMADSRLILGKIESKPAEVKRSRQCSEA